MKWVKVFIATYTFQSIFVLPKGVRRTRGIHARGGAWLVPLVFLALRKNAKKIVCWKLLTSLNLLLKQTLELWHCCCLHLAILNIDPHNKSVSQTKNLWCLDGHFCVILYYFHKRFFKYFFVSMYSLLMKTPWPTNHIVICSLACKSIPYGNGLANEEYGMRVDSNFKNKL